MVEYDITSHVIVIASFFLTTISYRVSERISVNISFPFDINTNTNSQKSFTGITIDMEVDTSRDWFVSLSTNSSRATLVHSDISFMVYTECV